MKNNTPQPSFIRVDRLAKQSMAVGIRLSVNLRGVYMGRPYYIDVLLYWWVVSINIRSSRITTWLITRKPKASDKYYMGIDTSCVRKADLYKYKQWRADTNSTPCT
jgi:hypothetical protein